MKLTEADAFSRLDENPGLVEKVKFFVGLVTIAPVRLILLLIVVVTYFLLAKIMLAFAPLQSNPPVRLWTRVASRSALFLLGFLWISVNDEHKAKGRKSPAIIVSNHISFIEILFFLSQEEIPAFVMKKTCNSVPLIGSIATQFHGGVQVDNKSVGQRGTEIIRDKVRRMEKERRRNPGAYHQPLVIFPEGTTSNGSCFLRFRSGAFVSGTPVQPVYFNFRFKNFSPTYESILTPVYFLRLVTQVYNVLEVSYLRPYSPNEDEKEDARLYAKNLQELFSDYSGLPSTDLAYKDKIKYHNDMRQQYAQLSKFGYHIPFLQFTRPSDILDSLEASKHN